MFPRRLGKAVAAAAPLYVEDVFSAFTYTGNGSTQSIVNGIDLAGKGGLVWAKATGQGSTTDHGLYDTVRGVGNALSSNTTGTQQSAGAGKEVSAFNSDGFSLGTDYNILLNQTSASYIAWTFRKAAKFFDVVNYTGTGVARTIAHNLGVAPGMIMIKRTDSTSDWIVYHRSLTNTEYSVLNTTAAKVTGATTYWNSATATSTDFSLGTAADVNTNTATYVAYLFAHDTASDGIIQCGTFTTDGSGNATVSLGWEPQYFLTKPSSTTGNWEILDTARKWDLSATDYYLRANTTDAQITASQRGNPTATGVSHVLSASTTYIYVAIRKGLMRPPTDATKVFAINARTGTGAAATVTAGSITQGVDLLIAKQRNGTGLPTWSSRLRGSASQIYSSSTAVEDTFTNAVTSFNRGGIALGGNNYVNGSGLTYINYLLKQARGFFDIVAYTGTGSAHTEAHNLGVVPELIITKGRSGASLWAVYYGDATDYLRLDSTQATTDDNTLWNDTVPTSSVFTVGTNSALNANTQNFIAYLFATLAGVSKIGTYTGNATTNQINCGFAAGARFVLIKRIDSTGDWYFWDTTRGIVSGNDPYLLLNSTAIEVTSTDYIDPYSAGFELSSTAPPTLNASGGTFMFLAIA
jgi:hypothetical protein